MELPQVVQKLKEEFDAERGFLLRLRTELDWNKEAFFQLVCTMQRYLELAEPSEQVERWIANGFWFTETFVQNWIRHPNFPRQHSPHYYEASVKRLQELSYWFFFGESPMKNGTLEPFIE